MKVIRTIEYEGDEDRIKQVLDVGFLKGEGDSHNVGRLTITETKRIIIKEEVMDTKNTHDEDA